MLITIEVLKTRHNDCHHVYFWNSISSILIKNHKCTSIMQSPILIIMLDVYLILFVCLICCFLFKIIYMPMFTINDLNCKEIEVAVDCISNSKLLYWKIIFPKEMLVIILKKQVCTKINPVIYFVFCIVEKVCNFSFIIKLIS